MEQRKLYRTLENITKEVPKFKKEEELLCYVLDQIIKNEEINIKGGRLWKLNKKQDSYLLSRQMGNVKLIKHHYMLKVDKYPIFKKVGLYRSIIAEETDEYLIEKGIYHYSATGVGDKVKMKDKKGETYFLYKYVMALNAKSLEGELLNTLNIISMTLSTILRTKSIETSVKENLQELEKAREIQKSILPEHEMNFGNYEIFGLSVPDKIVGGDFFDYLESEDKERMGIAIGDAASKGISAAAQALYVSGALKMGAGFQNNINSVISRINNLVHETFPNERFVTLFYCELLKDKKGLCQYVNAGQNSPLVLRSADLKFESLTSTGPVLGLAPYQRYYSDSINFNVNDLLVLYTDGIVEATNEKFEFFGEENIKESLIRNRHLGVKEISQKLLEDVTIFSSNGIYSDDRTIVVIRRVK